MFGDYQEQTQSAYIKEHIALTPEQAMLMDWGLGIGGESGEVQDIIKHHVFHHADLNKMELAKELGDVLWYLTAIAEATDMKVDDIADLNLAKTAMRYSDGIAATALKENRQAKDELFKASIPYRVISSRITHSKAPMNIIFVGPDGGGKTTLAKAVAEKVGFKYQKCDWRQEDKPELAVSLLESQIDVVYDRFYWPDEAIYSKVKKIDMPAEYWKKFDKVVELLCDYNTLIIYVDASEAILRARSKVWADDYINVNQLETIKRQYAGWLRYLETIRISTMKIDTSTILPESAEFDMLVTGCVEAIKAGQKVYARVLVEGEIDEG